MKFSSASAALLAAVSAAAVPGPANVVELECALHQAAFEHGSARVASNLGSLHDALNLGNCSSVLPAATVAANRAAILASPSRPGAAASAPAAAGGATVFVVATDGDDAAGDGSVAKPFATLAHARDQARLAKPAVVASIAMRGGKYFLSSTLQLDERDDGLAIGAYQGEQAVLSGGMKLADLSWAPATGQGMGAGVYVADAKLPTKLATAATGDGDACGLEPDTDFDGHDLKGAPVEFASDPAECCGRCATTPGCKTFTIEFATGGRCFLKESSAGRRAFKGHVSGTVGVAPTPAPYPTPAPTPTPPRPFGPAPPLVNSLFVNGTRAIRARFPNGNPQDQSGKCFSAVNRPGLEGCSGYTKAKGPSSPATLDGGTTVARVAHAGLNRGNSPTKGCGKQCEDYGSFKYTIYDPPAGHPVYAEPLPGWGWANNSVFSFWGSPFARPAGVQFSREGGAWTNKSWAHPETAVVHMFHSGLWGGWQFQALSLDDKTDTLLFDYGGYQEARGSGVKDQHFFVENVLEELDSANEWFYDAAAQKLYFQPNATDTDATSAAGGGLAALGASEVVVPLLDSLVTVKNATGIALSGLEFTETRSTFMGQYEVPSGGDWSIHRGGAVFVEDSDGVSVTHSLFDQVGGNAVFLSRHVGGANISANEFVHCGDSAIASVGVAAGIDGTAPTYPNGNTFANNHVHDYGVFGKQTSCYFQALSANATLRDNVCYNGPRAHVNFNDGFGGGTVMTGNLIFNAVRETGDHGPFNSWDRQPYLTRNGVDDGFPEAAKLGTSGASIVKAQCHIARNFIINGYNGVWAIDHDDGSQFFNDSSNVLVWGGCKNYRGNSKSCDGNVILYPGFSGRAAGGRRCQTDDNGIFANQYYHNNTCFNADGAAYSWGKCDASAVETETYHTESNTFYSADGSFSSKCGATLDLAAWQKLGQDHGSVTGKTPAIPEILDLVAQHLK